MASDGTTDAYAAPQIAARPAFQASGRVDWLKFVVLAPPTSAFMAFCAALGLAFFAWVGFSLAVIMPIIAGVGAGMAMYGVVRITHCRNWALAFFTGLAVGTVAYLYSFQLAAALESRDPFVALYILFLPDIIIDSVNSWTFGKPGQANNNAQPWPVFNWIMFAFEWICCAGATGALAGLASQSGYCERCLRWMTTKDVKTAPGAAQRVAVALADPAKSHELIMALPEIAPAATIPEFASFQLEGCTHNGAFDEANFYLTANEISGSGDSQKTITVLQKVALTPDEFALLATKIPGFAETK
jgi:hypothetical protein